MRLKTLFSSLTILVFTRTRYLFEQGEENLCWVFDVVCVISSSAYTWVDAVPLTGTPDSKEFILRASQGFHSAAIATAEAFGCSRRSRMISAGVTQC